MLANEVSRKGEQGQCEEDEHGSGRGQHAPQQRAGRGDRLCRRGLGPRPEDRPGRKLGEAGPQGGVDEHQLGADGLHLSPVLGKHGQTSESSLRTVFTGIVRERAQVVSFGGGRLVVETSVEAEIGDSVAVDGVCLTVVEAGGGRLAFDVVPETLERAKPFGADVNVEPALRAAEPLGGHYVQGHVDAVGRVRSSEPEGDGRRVWIEAPQGVLRYCVEKGSITVDGVSLTVAALDGSAFAVALVPHTIATTTLGSLEPGGEVNLEPDVLAKYVERLIKPDTMTA